ncbi:MAG: hypothetical protein VKJ44_01440 [Synechococcus sp.]|nr:hypothetical protein [Synechococcus sp.]
MRRSAALLLLPAGLLALAALATLPDPARQRVGGAAAPLPIPAGEAVPARDPSLRPLALLANGLLEELRQADRTWIPRAEPLPQGGIRYRYRHRQDEPPLTLAQIRALIAHPPDRGAEQRAIVALLQRLDQVGVSLSLSEPIKPEAAAEWDPRGRILRIRPTIPSRGSLEFARVLNHEALHVAQSCAAGGPGASPRPLLPEPIAVGTVGPAAAVQPSGPSPLQHPVYDGITPLERRLEEEAYALQNRLGLGERLLRLHCLDGRRQGDRAAAAGQRGAAAGPDQATLAM